MNHSILHQLKSIQHNQRKKLIKKEDILRLLTAKSSLCSFHTVKSLIYLLTTFWCDLVCRYQSVLKDFYHDLFSHHKRPNENELSSLI